MFPLKASVPSVWSDRSLERFLLSRDDKRPTFLLSTPNIYRLQKINHQRTTTKATQIPTRTVISTTRITKPPATAGRKPTPATTPTNQLQIDHHQFYHQKAQQQWTYKRQENLSKRCRLVPSFPVRPNFEHTLSR